MEKCAICKVIKGETAADIVYDDEQFLALLYLCPVNPGHLIVVPKKHYSSPTQMPNGEWGEMSARAAALGAACKHATKSEGYNLLICNGASAGQIMPHVCIHIIPRFADDGIALPARSMEFASAAEKLSLMARIRQSMKSPRFSCSTRGGNYRDENGPPMLIP